jgi:hypothetical protein
MFIFVVPTLQKKWNEIRVKELTGKKCMENDCFLRTLKFEMCIILRRIHFFLKFLLHGSSILLKDCKFLFQIFSRASECTCLEVTIF